MRSLVKSWYIVGAMVILLGAIGACAGDDDETVAQQPQQPAPATAPAAAQTADNPAAAAAAVGLIKTTPGAAAPAAPSPQAAAQFAAFPQDGMPQYGGQHRISGGDYPSLGVMESVSGGLKLLISQMYDSLVAWDWSSGYTAYTAVAPGLAESWDVSSDGTVWTFHLREGVRFHDGTPFTSADVKVTYDHYTNPPLDAVPPGSAYVKPVVSSVETPDPQTVVIKLKGPNPVVLFNMANRWAPIVAKKNFDQGLEYFRRNANGTGAFTWRRDKFEPGISYLVERNNDYWREGLPYLDSVQWHVMRGTAVTIAAFETKRIDDATVRSESQSKALLDRYGTKLNLIRARGASSINYHLNTRIAPFDNPKVRQAIYLWVDREPFLAKVGNNVGYFAGWVNREVFNYGTTSAEILQSNLAWRSDKTEARKKAKELLAEAGYSDLSGITLQMVPWGTASSNNTKSAQILASQLEELGFKTRLDVSDGLTSLQQLAQGDFQVGTTGIPSPVFGAPDPHLNRVANTIGQFNFTGLEDPTWTKLLRNMNTVIDPQKRSDNFVEMDRYSQTGVLAAYPFYWTDTMRIRWNYLHGRKYQTFYGDPFDRVWVGQDAPGR